MITNLLYRCPSCGGFEWLEQGRCRHCHVPVRVLSRKQVAVNGKPESIAFWYAKVKGHALPEGPEGMILESGPIRLSWRKEVPRASLASSFLTAAVKGQFYHAGRLLPTPHVDG